MHDVSGPQQKNLDTRLLRFVHDSGSEEPIGLASDLVESGQPLAALEVIAEGLRAKSDDPALLLLAGRAWLLEGDLIRSQKALLKAARVSPQDEEIFNWLGEVLLRRGDLIRARRVVRQALTLAPDNERALGLQRRVNEEEERNKTNLPVTDMSGPPPALQMRNEMKPITKGGPPPKRSVAFLLVVGVFFLTVIALLTVGWTRYRDYGRMAARGEFAKARIEVFRGGADLGRADRRLVERMKGQADPSTARLWVFGRTMSLLDEGSMDAAPLIEALNKSADGLDTTDLKAAQAALAWAQGEYEQARGLVDAVDGDATKDPIALYVIGRVRQRLRTGDSALWLHRAIRADATLAPAALALAEADFLSGEPQSQWVDRTIAQSPNHVRAGLWKYMIDPSVGKGMLDAQLSAPTDRVLSALARARGQGDPEARAKELGRAVQEGARDARLCELVAEVARRLGENTQMIDAYRAAVDAAPKDRNARIDLATTLVQGHNGGDAIDVLQDVPLTAHDVARVYGHAALLSGDRAAYQRAIDALEKFDSLSARLCASRIRCALSGDTDALQRAIALTKEAPLDSDAQLAAATCALSVGRLSTATSFLQPLVGKPGNVSALHQWGLLRQAMGNDQEALAAFSQVLGVAPAYGPSLLALGGLQLKSGSLDDAAKTFAMLRDTPGKTHGFDNEALGRVQGAHVLLRGGDMDGAATELAGVPPDKANVKLITLQSQIALALGKPTQAEQFVRTQAKSKDASVILVTLYADALYASGKTTRALTQYIRALDLDSGHAPALMGYTTSLIRAEKYPQAIVVAKRAIAAARKSGGRNELAKAQYLLGRAYEVTTKRSLARKFLERAVAQDNAPVEAWFFLGEALAGKSSRRARSAYQKYLSLAPKGVFAQRATRAIE